MNDTAFSRPASMTAAGNAFDLFLISFLILFLELACIRWFPAHALYLTEKGKSLMRELRKVNKAHEDRIAAGLSAEKRTLLIQMLDSIKFAADNPDE